MPTNNNNSKPNSKNSQTSTASVQKFNKLLSTKGLSNTNGDYKWLADFFDSITNDETREACLKILGKKINPQTSKNHIMFTTGGGGTIANDAAQALSNIFTKNAAKISSETKKPAAAVVKALLPDVNNSALTALVTQQIEAEIDAPSLHQVTDFSSSENNNNNYIIIREEQDYDINEAPTISSETNSNKDSHEENRDNEPLSDASSSDEDQDELSQNNSASSDTDTDEDQTNEQDNAYSRYDEYDTDEHHTNDEVNQNNNEYDIQTNFDSYSSDEEVKNPDEKSNNYAEYVDYDYYDDEVVGDITANTDSDTKSETLTPSPRTLGQQSIFNNNNNHPDQPTQPISEAQKPSLPPTQKYDRSSIWAKIRQLKERDEELREEDEKFAKNNSPKLVTDATDGNIEPVSPYLESEVEPNWGSRVDLDSRIKALWDQYKAIYGIELGGETNGISDIKKLKSLFTQSSWNINRQQYEGLKDKIQEEMKKCDIHDNSKVTTLLDSITALISQIEKNPSPSKEDYENLAHQLNSLRLALTDYREYETEEKVKDSNYHGGPDTYHTEKVPHTNETIAKILDKGFAELLVQHQYKAPEDIQAETTRQANAKAESKKRDHRRQRAAEHLDKQLAPIVQDVKVILHLASRHNPSERPTTGPFSKRTLTVESHQQTRKIIEKLLNQAITNAKEAAGNGLTKKQQKETLDQCGNQSREESSEWSDLMEKARKAAANTNAEGQREVFKQELSAQLKIVFNTIVHWKHSDRKLKLNDWDKPIAYSLGVKDEGKIMGNAKGIGSIKKAIDYCEGKQVVARSGNLFGLFSHTLDGGTNSTSQSKSKP